MKEVIIIGNIKNIRIFIRNRWTDCFSEEWNLINICRRWRRDRIEYIFCFIGIELCILKRHDF